MAGTADTLTDVMVAGGGAAGLSAAMPLHDVVVRATRHLRKQSVAAV